MTIVSVKAKVTPEVLFWARDSAGYSVDDVVEKLNRKSISSETIKAWERGEDKPTYAQLEKLAKYYKRPVAVFYFPSPPEEDGIDKKFRSLPSDYSLSLPPGMRFLVREALVKQLNLYDLHGSVLPREIQIFRNKVATVNLGNVVRLAAWARDEIGISLDEQFSWQNADDAMRQWRSALEEVGIWVFKDAFRDDNYSGFYLDDERFPVIYVNNSMAKQRQIFTLFHELAHLILGKSGIDFRENIETKLDGKYKKEEIFCNKFAGAFLVPDGNLVISSEEPSDREILDRAKKYKVSRQVILRKYLDKNLVSRDFYKRKVSAWKDDWKDKSRRRKQSDKDDSGGNYYATQKAYLGNRYLGLAFSEYYNQRINEYELADYLGVKIKSLGTLEGFMYKEGVG